MNQTKIKLKICSECGEDDKIFPLATYYGKCKKCIAYELFEFIDNNKFNAIIKNDFDKATKYIEIGVEFMRRNPPKYKEIPEETRKKFLDYVGLVTFIEC